MTIQERLARRSPEDVIYLGDVVEKHYVQSEFGDILEALLNGRVMDEALRQQVIPADRVLGRIEMAAKLKQDLEQYVIDRDKMKAPVEQEELAPDTTIAEEPSAPRIGGDM
jgi:hypothetical protein